MLWNCDSSSAGVLSLEQKLRLRLLLWVLLARDISESKTRAQPQPRRLRIEFNEFLQWNAPALTMQHVEKPKAISNPRGSQAMRCNHDHSRPAHQIFAICPHFAFFGITEMRKRAQWDENRKQFSSLLEEVESFYDLMTAHYDAKWSALR